LYIVPLKPYCQHSAGIPVGVGVGVSDTTNHGIVVVQVPVLAIVPPVIVSLILLIGCPVSKVALLIPVAIDTSFNAPPLVVPEILNGPAAVDDVVNVNVTVILFVSFYKYLFIFFYLLSG
jgi:hypothetical protein